MKQYPLDSMSEISDEIGTRIRLGGPFLSGRRQQEIRLYNDIPRIDFKTELLGFPGHDGLLTVVFPLGGEHSAWNNETHNAVTTRPDGIYYAQSFLDAQRSRGGVALLNRGPGGVQAEGNTVRRLLLRSVTNYWGYFSPNESEAGSHPFEYSLNAHSGDWRNNVVRQAHIFSGPLMPFATDPHPGTLPSHHGFGSVEEGQFEIAALKRSEDRKSLILCGHKTTGAKGKVTIALDHAPAHAWLGDLMERPGQSVPVRQGRIEFNCNAFEFVTLRLDEKP